MRILKIFFYIILLPLLLFLSLFFEYISWFNLVLIFSVFIFRDLKKLNYFWFLIIFTLLLDLSMNFWLGTFLLSLTFVLLLLLLFDKLVSNIFLDFVFVFFAFLLFRIFFSNVIFFQETMALQPINLDVFLASLLFALKNFFVYLILRLIGYFLKSYFRDYIV